MHANKHSKHSGLHMRSPAEQHPHARRSRRAPPGCVILAASELSMQQRPATAANAAWHVEGWPGSAPLIAAVDRGSVAVEIDLEGLRGWLPPGNVMDRRQLRWGFPPCRLLPTHRRV